MTKQLIFVISNFSVSLILVGILFIPLYLAKNISKVEGTKSEAKYLITSQIEKFPNLKYEQNNSTYTITFEKAASSQAFLSVFILTNPTNDTKIYKIESSSHTVKFFFSDNLDNEATQIKIPSRTSVPISFVSDSEDTRETVEFKIQTL